MKKAWRTMLCGVESIVAAETRRQAKAITLRSALDANYDHAKYVNCQARRAPEHDSWAEVDETHCCWEEKYLPENEAFLLKQ